VQVVVVHFVQLYFVNA